MRLLKQKGALMIAAIFVLTTVSLFASTIEYMAGSHLFTEVNVVNRLSAFEQAQQGLSRAVDALVNQGVSCATIHYTDTSYEVTGTKTSASSTMSSLSNGEVCVADASNYDSNGGILKIGNEYISYKSISENCFNNIVRGLKGTSETSHSTGSTVYQDQCRLESTGALPDRTNPKAESVIEAYYYAGGITGNVWSVGKAKQTILSFDLGAGNWTSHCSGSSCNSLPNREMYGLSCVYDDNDHVYCASVGDRGEAIRYRYYGGDYDWSDTNSGTSRDLNGVSCIKDNSDDVLCWAVGDNATVKSTNDGTSYWSSESIFGYFSDDLNDVSCSTEDDGSDVSCVAVGENGAVLRRYQGWVWPYGYTTGWTSSVSLPRHFNDDLKGVSCVYVNNQHVCVAVGDDGAAIYSNDGGADWSDYSTYSSRDFRDVSCVADGNTLKCWAITDDKVYSLSGTQWNEVYEFEAPNNIDLDEISCQHSESNGNTYCLAVGEKSWVAYYNGSEWSSESVSEGSNQDLHSVAVLLDQATTDQFILWREN